MSSVPILSAGESSAAVSASSILGSEALDSLVRSKACVSTGERTAGPGAPVRIRCTASQKATICASGGAWWSSEGKRSTPDAEGKSESA
eukprot:scaffold158602_cov37-Tisochrysis_lutea.AAC.4